MPSVTSCCAIEIILITHCLLSMHKLYTLIVGQVHYRWFCCSVIETSSNGRVTYSDFGLIFTAPDVTSWCWQRPNTREILQHPTVSPVFGCVSELLLDPDFSDGIRTVWASNTENSTVFGRYLWSMASYPVLVTSRRCAGLFSIRRCRQSLASPPSSG